MQQLREVVAINCNIGMVPAKAGLIDGQSAAHQRLRAAMVSTSVQQKSRLIEHSAARFRDITIGSGIGGGDGVGGERKEQRPCPHVAWIAQVFRIDPRQRDDEGGRFCFGLPGLGDALQHAVDGGVFAVGGEAGEVQVGELDEVGARIGKACDLFDGPHGDGVGREP